MKKSKIDRERLKEAMDFAKENGLAEIEVDGIKIKIEKPRPEPRELTEDEQKKISAAHQQESMSDEEVLFWHSDYYDELQEKKRLKEEHAREAQNLRGDES